MRSCLLRRLLTVSIHALLAECDLDEGDFCTVIGVSIHALLAECDRKPFFGATVRISFNPRTPCGVRPAIGRACAIVSAFQSTHSLRSATYDYYPDAQEIHVSIHALLAECDETLTKRKEPEQCFNPRTPCGVRRNRLYTLLLNRANHTLRQPP